MNAGQPLRVLVVDDEAPARNRLRDLLADCALKMPLEIAGEAATGRQALEMLPACDADVVLLDIRMPEIDGIETAQHIQKLDEPPAVIFTTAFDAYALKAFEVHAIDYLLKPIRAARLLEALARARSFAPLRAEVLREMKPDARSHLSVNERGRIHLIPIGDILFLKAELKYVTVRTAGREFLLEESLAKLEQEFFGRFVRVHRNCLVAKDAIRGFERTVDPEGEGHWVVLLNNVAEKIDVSRRQQHIVRELGRVS
ncbi:MAG TPA: LytTR family DNA-binding domain-containing protein [Burkholderiales bacterium]|jgi:two-component system response regulator AlgR|nr:LytTR family DNA-binding domain-containing protein [Burkholderiales bacterium]